MTLKQKGKLCIIKQKDSLCLISSQGESVKAIVLLKEGHSLESRPGAGSPNHATSYKVAQWANRVQCAEGDAT